MPNQSSKREVYQALSTAVEAGKVPSQIALQLTDGVCNGDLSLRQAVAVVEGYAGQSDLPTDTIGQARDLIDRFTGEGYGDIAGLEQTTLDLLKGVKSFLPSPAGLSGRGEGWKVSEVPPTPFAGFRRVEEKGGVDLSLKLTKDKHGGLRRLFGAKGQAETPLMSGREGEITAQRTWSEVVTGFSGTAVEGLTATREFVLGRMSNATVSLLERVSSGLRVGIEGESKETKEGYKAKFVLNDGRYHPTNLRTKGSLVIGSDHISRTKREQRVIIEAASGDIHEQATVLERNPPSIIEKVVGFITGNQPGGLIVLHSGRDESVTGRTLRYHGSSDEMQGAHTRDYNPDGKRGFRAEEDIPFVGGIKIKGPVSAQLGVRYSIARQEERISSHPAGTNAQAAVQLAANLRAELSRGARGSFRGCGAELRAPGSVRSQVNLQTKGGRGAGRESHQAVNRGGFWDALFGRRNMAGGVAIAEPGASREINMRTSYGPYGSGASFAGCESERGIMSKLLGTGPETTLFFGDRQGEHEIIKW